MGKKNKGKKASAKKQKLVATEPLTKEEEKDVEAKEKSAPLALETKSATQPEDPQAMEVQTQKVEEVIQDELYVAPSKKELYTMTEAYGEFWNHIKFRKAWDKPLFPREEVEDLLMEAADYVVRIRKLLDKKDSSFKLRTVAGASHEFLWKLRWHPWHDPDLFVKNLVHATFTDANGYLEGLTETTIDEYISLIKQRAATQGGDKTKTQAMIEDLYKEVDKNLQGVVDSWKTVFPVSLEAVELAGRRHLGLLHSLKNRLMRIQTDLASLVQRKEIDKQQQPKIVEGDLAPKQLERAQSKSDDGVIQIKKVAGDVELVASQLQHLKERTEDVKLTFENLSPEAAQKKVEEFRKRCLVLSEQLMRDLLSLDQIVCEQEAKPLRKAQIQHINSLLDDADAVKKKLQKMEEELRPKLEERKVAEEAGEAEHKEREAEVMSAKEESTAPVSKTGGKKKTKEKELAKKEPEVDEAKATVAQAKRPKEQVEALSSKQKLNQPQQPQQQLKQAAQEPMPPPKKPGKKDEVEDESEETRWKQFWEALKLKPKFEVNENAEQYVVAAYIPGMSLKDVHVSLESQDSVLVVEGVRCPSVEELEALRGLVAQRGGDPNSKIALLRMASGRYGKFSERFSIPRDVEVGRIQASYKGGTFMLVLPKVSPPVTRRAPFYGGLPAPSGPGLFDPVYGGRRSRPYFPGDSDFFW